MRVDADWVAGHLDDPAVRIVEVDVSSAAFAEGHIPGAVLWDAYTDLRHSDYSPIDSDELDAVLSKAGVAPEATVVFYGYAPYLGYWLMDRHGHERIRLMEGGRDPWESAGYAWTAETSQPEPTAYERGSGRPERIASRREVQAAIDDPGTVLVDVRSAEEFSGERFWPSGATEGAGRPGRIPGAVHVPVDLIREGDGSLADGEELRAVCDRLNLDRGSRLITYCTIGNRASQAAFALEQLLGYPDVAVYYGSWSEWGSLPDTPVET